MAGCDVTHVHSRYMVDSRLHARGQPAVMDPWSVLSVFLLRCYICKGVWRFCLVMAYSGNMGLLSQLPMYVVVLESVKLLIWNVRSVQG